MHRQLFVVGILLFIAPLCSQAARDSAEMPIEGYDWACEDEQLAAVLSSTLAATFNLVDCAITSEDVERWNSGEELEMAEYFLLAEMGDKYKSYNQKKLFKEFKRQFKKSFQELIADEARLKEHVDSVDNKLSNLSDMEVESELSSITPLGEWRDKRTSYAYGALVTHNTTIDGELFEVRQVTVTSAYLNKSEVFVLYYFRDYNSDADVTTAKYLVDKWFDNL